MPADRFVVSAAAVVLLGGAAASRRSPRVARFAVAASALALTVFLAVRWALSRHPPVFGTFEMDVAETLCLLAAALVLERRVGAAYLRAPAIAGALTLAHTWALRTEVTPLTISEQSLWIDLHAPLAWLAWTAYFHAAFLAFRGGEAEDVALRVLGLGFVAQSAMGFVGVYYATLIFATPWSWDPVQTLGLMSWLLAALALHFRLFHAVSLHRQKYFMLIVAAAFVVSAKLVMLLAPGQSFHVFELGNMAGEGGP